LPGAGNRRYLTLQVLALLAAGALPLAFPAALAVAIFPPSFVQLARDWAVLSAFAFGVGFLLKPLCRGLMRASVMVALASITTSVYPLALSLGRRVHAGESWVDGGLIVVLAVVALQLQRTPERDARELLVVLALCCAVPSIFVAVISIPSYTELAGAGVAEAETFPLSTPVRPSIYHIVLDGLGRANILSQRFGMSLGPFVTGLRERGFTVSDCASANYPQTYLSLASMLNADLLQNLADLPPTSLSRIPAKHLIRDSRVISSLRNIGYRIVWIGSGYSATADYPLADDCMCERPWVGEFEAAALAMTGLRRLFPASLQAAAWAGFINDRLSRISSLSATSEPTFTFVHVLSPHPPFVFRRDGSLAPQTGPVSFLGGLLFSGTDHDYLAAYAAQATYVVGEALRSIDHLLAIAPRNSILILHGDHGPRAPSGATDVRLSAAESIPTFLAIRWPDGTLNEREPITLVNVYRRLLSRHFGAHLPDVPNRTFASDSVHPYAFLEMPAVPCVQ
jgi:Sulfatase